MRRFVAIDFETANHGRESACELGLVRVEGSRVVAERSWRIRPPSRYFVPFFSELHGITWADVKDEPDFAERWPEIAEFLDGADFLAAHNSAFDRGVLEAACARYRIAPPAQAFVCTVSLVRNVWGIYPSRLPDACRALRIPLARHHQALADARACAEIVRRALRELGSRRFARLVPRAERGAAARR